MSSLVGPYLSSALVLQFRQFCPSLLCVVVTVTVTRQSVTRQSRVTRHHQSVSQSSSQSSSQSPI